MKRRALRKRYGRTQASIGHGWRHIEPQHRYAIVGLIPKRGGHVGEYLKKRHVVGRARDAHEAIVELYRLRDGQHGSWGQGRWAFIVLDMHAGKGKLAPIVSELELESRKSRGG